MEILSYLDKVRTKSHFEGIMGDEKKASHETVAYGNQVIEYANNLLPELLKTLE